MDALKELLDLGTKATGGSEQLFHVCLTVLKDGRFLDGIASAAHHPESHQVPGGLVVHTYEVAKAAVEMSGTDFALARLAYVAAVFHDYGKIHEYAWSQKERKVSKTPFARLCGHVVFGYTAFIEAAHRLELDPADVGAIAHAILAHHGRLEWGSPVEPQTRLAYIIHTADMLSAKGLTQCS